MDEYMTIKETAELWGVTPRWVQTLCINGKIEGAIKFGRAWAIPRNTPKPKDGRETSGGIKIGENVNKIATKTYSVILKCYNRNNKILKLPTLKMGFAP